MDNWSPEPNIRSLLIDRDSNELVIETFFSDYAHQISLEDPKSLVKFKKMLKAVELFSDAISPASLTLESRLINEAFIAWIYLIDDAVTDLGASVKDEYQKKVMIAFLNSLMKYHISSWEAGIFGKPMPVSREVDYLNYDHPTLLALGRALYEIGDELSALSPSLERSGEEFVHLTDQLKEYLEALAVQVDHAPQTPGDYLVQHFASGAVKPAFTLNALLKMWSIGLESPDLTPFENIVDAGTLVIILTNDAMFGKDIGKPEELLFSTMLKEKILNIGDDNEKEIARGFDLSTPQAHGEILAILGGGEIGFKLTQELNDLIREAMFDLIDLVIESSQTESDSAVVESIFRLCFGYFIYNSISTRYSKAFELYRAAVCNDLEGYQRVFSELKNMD